MATAAFPAAIADRFQPGRAMRHTSDSTARRLTRTRLSKGVRDVLVGWVERRIAACGPPRPLSLSGDPPEPGLKVTAGQEADKGAIRSRMKTGPPPPGVFDKCH